MNMRKSVFFICIIILIPMVLFAEVILPEPAKLNVVVTGTRQEFGAYDFGFCKNKINSYDMKPEHFVGDVIPDLGIGLNDKGKTVAKSAPESLFLYWRLVSDDPIDFQLSISGALRHSTANADELLAENSPKRLDWKVKWPINSTIPEDALDSTAEVIDYKTIKSYTPSLTESSEGGSIPIDIETYPIVGKYSEGRYSGNLLLKVVVK